MRVGITGRWHALRFEGGPDEASPEARISRLQSWRVSTIDSEPLIYETAGGLVKMNRVPRSVKIQIIAEDRASKYVECASVISEIEREVLVNDKAIDELEVIILSPGRGLWRFADEDKLRGSLKPKYW